MRIATFNLWNSDTMRERRIEAICHEMKQVDADIVALQEVWMHGSCGVVDWIATNCGYAHTVYRQYPDDQNEGLAFMSKRPIASVSTIWDSVPEKQIAIRAVIKLPHSKVAVTNVHLDWSSALTRENEIVELERWLSAQYSSDTYEVLCGDFNGDADSSVHRFLTGRQSLGNRATLWTDVAEYYADKRQKSSSITLDFYHHPRWSGVANIEIPMRCDWILLKQDYPNPSPVIQTVRTFGTAPSGTTGVFPSDHYGVALDTDFPATPTQFDK